MSYTVADIVVPTNAADVKQPPNVASPLHPAMSGPASGAVLQPPNAVTVYVVT